MNTFSSFLYFVRPVVCTGGVGRVQWQELLVAAGWDGLSAVEICEAEEKSVPTGRVVEL
jgi:hypothetical protein